jgi:hypothetical protein
MLIEAASGSTSVSEGGSNSIGPSSMSGTLAAAAAPDSSTTGYLAG